MDEKGCAINMYFQVSRVLTAPQFTISIFTTISHEHILWHMNEGQIKIKILLIQTVDWSLLIFVFSVGIYAVLYSENKNLMAIATLIGLFLVNWLGQISINKIAALRMDLKKQDNK